MNDGSQIYYFLICVCLGACSGVVYDFFYCLRVPFKSVWARIIFDALFCVVFAFVYIFSSVLFELPSLRLYTFAGCVIGLLLYLKSFHKIVAFFAGRVYNSISQVIKRKLYARAERRKITGEEKD